jgi:hypothetical protein
MGIDNDQPVFEKVEIDLEIGSDDFNERDNEWAEQETAQVAELSKKGWPKGELTTAERIELEDLKYRLERR